MKTILIIEDNAIMRQKIATILKLEGYETVLAKNGQEGVAAAREELPDLILCDIMMPEYDGYAVLGMLQQTKSTARIPFIFLTAKGERADIRSGMNLGADDYLVKPVPRSELLDAINARLEKNRLIEERFREEMSNLKFEPDFSSPAPLIEQLGLTPREAETLLWVAQGKSNGEIAIILGTGEKTVKKFMGSIFDKLGVNNRTGAGVRALEVLSSLRGKSNVVSGK